MPGALVDNRYEIFYLCYQCLYSLSERQISLIHCRITVNNHPLLATYFGAGKRCLVVARIRRFGANENDNYVNQNKRQTHFKNCTSCSCRNSGSDEKQRSGIFCRRTQRTQKVKGLSYSGVFCYSETTDFSIVFTCQENKNIFVPNDKCGLPSSSLGHFQKRQYYCTPIFLLSNSSIPKFCNFYTTETSELEC